MNGRSSGAVVGGLLLGACAGTPAPAPPPERPDELVLLGPLTRPELEAALPGWVAAQVEATPDRAAALRLADGGDGVEVSVYLGTWCPDSRRELARLWRALDEAGGEPGFALDYVGVDRDKRQPVELVAAAGLQFVPTVIVRRDGRELGRIVERSPSGIEIDLAALLDGTAGGVLSGRPDADEAPADGPG